MAGGTAMYDSRYTPSTFEYWEGMSLRSHLFRVFDDTEVSFASAHSKVSGSRSTWRHELFYEMNWIADKHSMMAVQIEADVRIRRQFVCRENKQTFDPVAAFCKCDSACACTSNVKGTFDWTTDEPDEDTSVTFFFAFTRLNVSRPMSMAEFAKPLLNDKDTSDVIVVCADKTFHCHKVFLTRRSQYFERMFKSDFSESRKNEIPITGLEPEVVEQVLTFIYQDKVDEDSVTWELFNAAKMYELERLQQLCLRGLRRKLDVSNCCQMLEAAFLHDLEKFFNLVITFMEQNSEELKEEWKEKITSPELVAKLVLRGF